MKKLIIILLIIAILITGGVIYLNQVVLPVELKSLIISTLKKQTAKDVTLKSVQFSIFRGFVLRDLVISDQGSVILSTRQASCTVFIWPIFKKQIIIPNINFKSPYIFIERFPDGSFNLEKFLVLPQGKEKKADFNVSVLNVGISSGNIVFQDDTLAVKFKKELKDIQFNVNLSLPASLKFNFKGQLQSEPSVLISASGQYKILSKEFAGHISVKPFSLKEFAPYYYNLANLVSGLINLEAQIGFKEDMLKVNLALNGQNLSIEKGNLKAKLNTDVKVDINYNLTDKGTDFNGYCDISQSEVDTGMDMLGQIKDINGKFDFDRKSLSTNSLKAKLLGLPFDFKINVKDFNAPVLMVNTDLDLAGITSVTREKFKLKLIESASGKAALEIKASPDKNGLWMMQGKLNISKADLKLEKRQESVEAISGIIEFTQQGISWKDAKFKYKGLDYQTNGSLSNYVSPLVKLELSSADLDLTSEFILYDKRARISYLKGNYLDSQFSIMGDVDNSVPAVPVLNLSGRLALELSNISKLLDKQYPVIETLRPLGKLNVNFILKGSLSDFTGSTLEAEIKSNGLSLYGLRAQNLSMNVSQNASTVKITDMNLGIYEGLIQGSGILNLKDPTLPYQIELKVNGIKLEKLKLDTASKDKNISGNLSGELMLYGFKDMDKLSAKGNFIVKEGKLWELNLLRGAGRLLFTRDLGNIEISECQANFILKDKFVYTDNLQLKGNLVNLSGPLKIGFDGSLMGSLSVNIVSEMVPISGTLRDLATEIIGQGIFGVINLSGTLKEPKYSFKPAVADIIRGLKGVFFGK